MRVIRVYLRVYFNQINRRIRPGSESVNFEKELSYSYQQHKIYFFKLTKYLY